MTKSAPASPHDIRCRDRPPGMIATYRSDGATHTPIGPRHQRRPRIRSPPHDDTVTVGAQCIHEIPPKFCIVPATLGVRGRTAEPWAIAPQTDELAHIPKEHRRRDQCHGGQCSLPATAANRCRPPSPATASRYRRVIGERTSAISQSVSQPPEPNRH